MRYQDRFLTLDDDGVTIRWYYFPAGTKRIPWRDLERVEEHDLRGRITNGRWRIWGSGDLRHWFHLDWGRPGKDTAFVLHVGKWTRPVVTPAEPETFRRLLLERGVRVT